MPYNGEHPEEEIGGDAQENVYSEQGRSKLLREDEINACEYGVMRGYEESPAQKVVRDYEVQELEVTSGAFKENEDIPRRYSCEGLDVNPPLKIEGIPQETKSLVIIMEDVDSKHRVFTHWVLFNVDPEMNEMAEDSSPGIEGLNDFGEGGYGGPCPESGKHRYVFNVYALNRWLELGSESVRKDVQQQMQPYIVGRGSLTGLYEKSD